MFKTYELEEGLPAIKCKIEMMRKMKVFGPLVVGVAGGSGSGKTTKVAKEIHDRFLVKSVILSMDDYFKGIPFMESIDSRNFDDPLVIDLELLRDHLKMLKMGLFIEKPVYSFQTGTRQGYVRFEPADLIILEGLFTLCEPIINEVDLKVFVDISVHGSLLRRLLRDVGRTGQTEQDIFKQYTETVYPMYKLHIEPTKALADIVIVNQYVPEIEAELCKSQEIQIKASLRKEFLSGALHDVGFRENSAVFSQEDIYYSAPNWKPPYHNELMRVRREKGKYFLAYKGPLCDESLRVKPKIEFEVDSALKDSLEKLGYKRLLFLVKKRRKFVGVRDDALESVLDEFEDGSRFLEFRAKTQEGKDRILDLLKKLGIRKKDITRKSYLEIYLNKKTSA